MHTYPAFGYGEAARPQEKQRVYREAFLSLAAINRQRRLAPPFRALRLAAASRGC